MKIIAMVAGLILCAGAFFQVQASCITTESVTTTENQKVNLVKENGKEVGYEMLDEETGEWFKAEVVGQDSHQLPIFDFTETGKADKEDHISQNNQGGGPGGGGGGGGPH